MGSILSWGVEEVLGGDRGGGVMLERPGKFDFFAGGGAGADESGDGFAVEALAEAVGEDAGGGVELSRDGADAGDAQFDGFGVEVRERGEVGLEEGEGFGDG